MHFQEIRRRVLAQIKQLDPINDPFFLFLTAQLLVRQMHETLSDTSRCPSFLGSGLNSTPNAYQQFVDTGLLLVGFIGELMPYMIITPWGAWSFAPTIIGKSAWPNVQEAVYCDIKVGEAFYREGVQVVHDDRLFPVTEVGGIAVPQFQNLDYNYGNTKQFDLLKRNWLLHQRQFDQLITV